MEEIKERFLPVISKDEEFILRKERQAHITKREHHSSHIQYAVVF